MRNRGISVEKLLNGIGGKRIKLPNFLTEKWFHFALAEGFREQKLWLTSTHELRG